VQAYSSSLEYIIANGVLHGLVSGTYANLNANLVSFTSYSLANYQNYLIITGFNSAAGTSIQRTVYIGSSSNGKYSSINTFTISSTGDAATNKITFAVSP
jgi:hypothetical protein